MRQRKRWIIGFTAIMSLALIMAAFATRGALAAGTTYYVNCTAGSDSNNGTSTSTAWPTLAKVTATTFTPGDSVRYVKMDSTVWFKPADRIKLIEFQIFQ